jgi:ribosomal 50S subunit-recycling heat shock protein
MKRFIVVFWIVMFTLSLGVAVAGAQGAAKSAAKPDMEEEDMLMLTAPVQAVDQEKRTVTVKGSGGKLLTFKAGKEVKNFAQIKVGDLVVVQYYESIAIQVKKPGEAKPGVTAAEVTARAKPGEKPAGMVAEQVTVTAVVEAIAADKKSVTLKGPEGNSVPVKVKNPKYLENVKVGDQVVVTYTEALVINVVKVEIKKGGK